MYQVVEVEGKGLCCLATEDIKKGTLILNGVKQMGANAETEPMGSSEWINILMENFRQMTHEDQLEFMTLRTICSEEIIDSNHGLRSKIEMIEEDSQRVEEIFQICCIYISNRMDDGFRIKVSQIKHSCQPNAMTSQKPNVPFEVRAITDIKAGEEITVNLSKDQFFGFRNKEYRKNSLLNAPPFIHCSCELCQNEIDIDNNTFQELIDEAEELALSPSRLENYMEKITCYGKAKKIQPYFLYFKILKKAFNFAMFVGYMKYQSDEFVREAENLRKAMKKFEKIFGEE